MKQLSALIVLLLWTVCAYAQSSQVNTRLVPLPAPYQFVNQILRPCASGATPFAKVEANPGGVNGNVDVTTCVGGQFRLNGATVGSVTSVGLALPVSVFSVSGSPVTSTGTLTGAFVNQTANTLFAGPSSGGAATPAFRTIVAADLGTGGADATTFLRGDLTWQTISASGITSLNTLTTATQTFAVGTTGTDVNISSVTSTHTFNFPDASATARGLITTGTQTVAGQKTFTGVHILNNRVDLGGTVNGNVRYFFSGGVDPVYFFNATNAWFAIAANRQLVWTNLTDNASGTPDTGLARNAAGVVEVNNGTKGTIRDLTLRNLIASGQGSHIQQSAANSDIAGTISLVAATSASKTFTTAYTNAPICTISPQADPGVVTSFWVTTTTTAVTVNASASSTIDFAYICIGNPN